MAYIKNGAMTHAKSFVTLYDKFASLCIFKSSCGDDDKVDECPDATPSAGYKLQESCPHLAHIEAMDAQAPKKKAE